ncbi:MAG: sigma-70 family RNA polymerase sigma factor [Planctomycetota bacterium]
MNEIDDDQTAEAGQEQKGQDSDSIRMTKQLLTEQFEANRERLWRTVQVRMDQRLYGRVDPDDILQEAYMDAMKRVGHFAEEVSYTPFVWLRLIVGQTLINVHRRHIGAQMRDASRERSTDQKMKHEMSATSQSVAFHLAANQTSPSQVVAREEAVEGLTHALEELSDIDREILTLRHFEDLSNKEVAELLDIEQKAASIRYVRALQRLKKVLGDDFFQMPD